MKLVARAIGLWIAGAALAAPLPDVASSESRVGAVSQPVTAETLLENERYWPYQVMLTRAWPAAEPAEPLRAGVLGVLIRVESAQAARIDFGRNGRHRVPIDHTDLVERADRVRRGELRKAVPNFLLAIGTKLVDAAYENPRPFRVRDAGDLRGALCVFADPGGPGFDALAESLRPLQSHPGVLTILFPLGEHRDADVAARLRSLAWAVPFVFDRYAEAYTRSQLGDETPVPAVLLQTTEGRLLFHSAWRAEVASQLASAMDAAFGAAPVGDAGS